MIGGSTRKSPLTRIQYLDLSSYERQKHIARANFLEDPRVKDFFREVESKFKENWQAYEEKRVSDWPGTPLSGLPDFLARKGKDMYAVEVKTNKAYLLASQMTVLEIAKKHGIKPYVLYLDLNSAAHQHGGLPATTARPQGNFSQGRRSCGHSVSKGIPSY